MQDINPHFTDKRFQFYLENTYSGNHKFSLLDRHSIIQTFSDPVVSQIELDYGNIEIDRVSDTSEMNRGIKIKVYEDIYNKIKNKRYDNNHYLYNGPNNIESFEIIKPELEPGFDNIFISEISKKFDDSLRSVILIVNFFQELTKSQINTSLGKFLTGFK